MSYSSSLEELECLFETGAIIHDGKSWYEGATFTFARGNEELFVDLRLNDNFIHIIWRQAGEIKAELQLKNILSIKAEEHKGMRSLFVEPNGGHGFLVVNFKPVIRFSMWHETPHPL